MEEVTAAHIRGLTTGLRESGHWLRSCPSEALEDAIVAACLRLGATDSDVGKQARSLLPQSSGLSEQMVVWGLETTLGGVTREAMARLASPAADGALPAPARLTTVILAGNVFTASVRAILHPLLLRSPVLAKASSRDDVLPRLLKLALDEAEPALGRCLQVVTFAGGSADREGALLAEADVASVYGSDATVTALRGQLPATTRLAMHGHGLGVVYVSAEGLTDEAVTRGVARAIARDVAAYDQRGCLSPHAVLVEPGGAVSPRRLAALIAEPGLAELATTWPRGILPPEAATLQVQWRLVAQACGELFEGDGYASSLEEHVGVRLSPGYRNVSVMPCARAELGQRLAPLGAHLKALGIAGRADTRRAVAESLPAGLCPRVCAVGTMQTPPFDAYSDGEPPMASLARYIQVD